MLANPTVDPSAFISPNVVMWGDVHIGPDVVVLPGVVMRAEYDRIVVGERSNLQDNVVIHVDKGFPAIIGRNVTVGHRAMLHGCRIGDGALIGMSATLLNGSVIGDGAMVAAGSLVPPGMEIPAGMLAIGSPARVRRPLTDDEIAGQAAGVEHYQDYAALYRAAGIGD